MAETVSPGTRGKEETFFMDEDTQRVPLWGLLANLQIHQRNWGPQV